MNTKVGHNLKSKLIFLSAILFLWVNGLLFTGCHTTHDIHITLDIRLIEAEVGGEGAGTRSLAGGQEALKSPSDIQLTPKLEKAIASRRARLADVRQAKTSKQAGENNQGLLAVTPDAKSLYGSERQKLWNIVEGENWDRETIFTEISNIRKTPIFTVRQEWAKELREELGPNQWFQAPEDPDYYRQFLESELGKAFPSAPQSRGWAQAPPAYMPGGGM